MISASRELIAEAINPAAVSHLLLLARVKTPRDRVRANPLLQKQCLVQVCSDYAKKALCVFQKEVTLVLIGSSRRPGFALQAPSAFQRIWKALHVDRTRKIKSVLRLRFSREII
jgi:hypothetical protein